MRCLKIITKSAVTNLVYANELRKRVVMLLFPVLEAFNLGVEAADFLS